MIPFKASQYRPCISLVQSNTTLSYAFMTYSNIGLPSNNVSLKCYHIFGFPSQNFAYFSRFFNVRYAYPLCKNLLCDHHDCTSLFTFTHQ